MASFAKILLTARLFQSRTLAARGYLHRAEAIFQQMLQEPWQSSNTAFVHFDMAALCLERNRLEEVKMHLQPAMEISTRTNYDEFLSKEFGRIGI